MTKNRIEVCLHAASGVSSLAGVGLAVTGAAVSAPFLIGAGIFGLSAALVGGFVSNSLFDARRAQLEQSKVGGAMPPSNS
jgi:hypothetical protein